jgi:CRISPR system Cascade subunit CasE
MYLSRLIINLKNRQVQKELANRYELHRTIMRAFPATLPEGERILYRVEERPPASGVQILIQSASHPDWHILPTDYLIQDAELKGYALELSPGEQLYFRLLANPTRKIKAIVEPGKEPEAKRVGLLRDEDQETWLLRKAAMHGFQVLNLQISHQPDVKGFTPGKALTFHAVQFDGMLQVIDSPKVVEAVRKGIGSGKGFGCGLLSLAKI